MNFSGGRGSDIDLHVFCDSVEGVSSALEGEGIDHSVQRKGVRKEGVEQTFVHIHIEDRFPIELTIYRANKAHYVFKSSITGKAIERTSIRELEQFLVREYPDLDLDAALAEARDQVDRFEVYESLLLPLENVGQGRTYHPEGDVLYHSLQVFDHARDMHPYD